ncbi:MAG: FAD-dependent monooxygenase [Variibacter sp.]|nr:FAD-dependent monooxygenase [Variibacter sp.]
MADTPNILIAGAGIGGLAAALALSRAGFRVTVMEAAPELREIGAGIQLSPNATRILLDLGLGPALARVAVRPEALRVMNAGSGEPLAVSPLGEAALARYGAPFLTIHRGDLQRLLAEAAREQPTVDLHLGARAEDVAARDGGIVVVARGRLAAVQMQGAALVAADGIWSTLRGRLGLATAPVFYRQTAWRALLPVAEAPVFACAPAVNLWLGPHAHAVHYPVCGGAAVNIVVIIREEGSSRDWATPGDPAVLRARVARWSRAIRDLLHIPQAWEKWALHALPPLPGWGTGPMTLLGDAAHAMRPFLAQGAVMAIEDAEALARHAAAHRDDLPAAWRAYEAERRPRTARVQAASEQTGERNGWRGPLALARNLALRHMGGQRLLAMHDWIYDWRR